MALIWIAMAAGLLLAILLIVRILRTHPSEAVGRSLRCATCGARVSGRTCPRCDRGSSFGR